MQHGLAKGSIGRFNTARGGHRKVAQAPARSDRTPQSCGFMSRLCGMWVKFLVCGMRPSARPRGLL